jgi:hypothetical protein
MNPLQALDHIHRTWIPHETQLAVGHALFYEKKKRIFLECGRKWGKGEILAYIIWRWCLTFQNQHCYYMAPLAKQSRELLWANRRIQNFAGQASRKIWQKPPNNSQMRVFFRTNSWIKLDGSDNVDSYRGVNPHLIIYDEFKDFKEEFHEAMEPNLTSFEAPLIIAGTPPKTSDNQFTRVAKEIQDDPDGAYFNFESEDNPYLSKDWLEKTRTRLFAMGDEEIWFREYKAKRVVGGKSHIIPTFNKKVNVKPHDKIMAQLQRDMPRLEWITIADPGTITVFGVLFMAVNKYTKRIYILDEIYETEQKLTSSSKIHPRVKRIQHDLTGHQNIDWLQVVDCAAAWFANEIMSTFQEYWQPSDKFTVKKDRGISLIKDQCWRELVEISDRCIKLIWEVENYIKDKNGNIPKINDHLIDCWRYGNTEGGLDLLPEEEPEKINPQYRGFTIDQDLNSEQLIVNTDSDYYDY